MRTGVAALALTLVLILGLAFPLSGFAELYMERPKSGATDKGKKNRGRGYSAPGYRYGQGYTERVRDDAGPAVRPASPLQPGATKRP